MLLKGEDHVSFPSVFENDLIEILAANLDYLMMWTNMIILHQIKVPIFILLRHLVGQLFSTSIIVLDPVVLLMCIVSFYFTMMHLTPNFSLHSYPNWILLLPFYLFITVSFIRALFFLMMVQYLTLCSSCCDLLDTKTVTSSWK